MKTDIRFHTEGGCFDNQHLKCIIGQMKDSRENNLQTEKVPKKRVLEKGKMHIQLKNKRTKQRPNCIILRLLRKDLTLK